MLELEDTSDSTSLRDSSSSGNILGDYIKEERIGKGGFGEVYKAQHRHLKNHVVIKVLRPDHRDESLAALLVREGQVLTRLCHPNIVRVLGLSMEADDQIYLIMDYINGGDLAALLRNTDGPLAVEEVVQIINQVAEGLNYVHQHHIIHRDLKPQNILRDKSGRIVIADFGLAKVLDTARSQTSQSSRMGRAGTPPYMAPEHWDGKAEYRSDLYSLGIITYQLLTKQLPFTGNELQIQIAHRQKEPLPLREFNPRLTPEIERVVLKMLEKDPQKRYQTALDFARDLRSIVIQKTLKAMRTDPDHIREALENIAEDRVLSLGPGEYQGPFTLDKRLHLIGSGQSTKLYTVDEPVLHIQVPGVQLENMVIQRTRESEDEPVIQAGEQVSYIVRHVSIQGGQADEACWEDAEWQLPVGGIDFGRIPVESQQSREVQIEVKEKCTLTVKSNLPGLAVFPTCLCPGPHKLKLEFHASGSPPGTHLDGSIQLQGESESKEIHVTGKLEEPAPPPIPTLTRVEEPSLTPMEWQYALWDEPSRRLLSELGDAEGKNLAAQWQADKRNPKLTRQIVNGAENLVFDLVGRKACRWYVRRLRVNKKQDADEEIWELILAIDGPNFPPALAERKKTLRLECRVLPNGKGKLRISDIAILSQDKGVENLTALPALVRLATFIPDYQGIPTEFIEQIQNLPIKSADKLDVDQIQGWQALLEFQSDQIKKRQYWVGYRLHNYREGDAKVTFFLDKENTRNGAQEPITYQEFQELARKSRRELLKIFETLPTSKERKRRNQDITIGSVERFFPEPGTLEIKLDPKIAARLKSGVYSLPQEGYLHFEAGGDLLQAERHQEALNILKQGRAANPLLGDFFFDARKARPIEGIQQLLPVDLLSGTCNNGQIAAIEAALATPDLLLIQGPPGTGKTTVIAEICYQVALRGGRTLIASQSNLAVDNALGRIIHHPRVRALRKGNPETVEDEGRAYTEEHVVRKWLNNTAKECQAKLEQRQKNIALFRRLRGATERFVYYRAMEVAWENQHLSLQRRHAALTQEIREIADSIAQNEEEERKYAPIRQALSVLLAGEINQSRSETSTALQGAFQYLFVETADRLHFITQVNTGLRIVQQVDLAPPADRHLLACLVWLKETMHTHNTAWTRSRQLIDQTEDEMASLSRAGRLQQELASSIRDKKSQVQALAAQMESLQTTLQHLDGEMDRLQRATATLQMLPKDGVGSIASILKKFLDTELPKQLAGQRQFTRLEIRTAFPHEIIAVIQGDAAAAFLKWWDGAERTIQARLQRVLREIEEYNQNRDRFRRCGQDFQKALALYPEIQQQLVAVPLGSPSLPNISFSQLVSLIENNVKWIHEIHTKSPGFMDKVLKEKEKQLLMLFIATRDLGVAAQRQQNSIPDEINQANARFTENIATNLSSSLLQWLNERQQEVENTRQTALQKKDHLEAEREHILKLCEEEEARLAEAKRSFNASIQRLTGMFQELSKCTRIPETLRRAARQNASSIATALTASEEYRTACQNWIGDLQHLEALVDELWRELQAAHGKLQQQVAQIQAALGPQRHRASKLRSEREELETLIQHKHSTLQAQRQWWGEFWETIPQHLRPLAPPEGIFALPLLETVEKQFMAWETELAKEEYKAQRYDRLITDWITALRNLSEGEQAKLQEVYIQNANVIGITCGQAPRLTRRELRTFASFDTVIIDEVSKATAPELLLPAIKGKKLILIGDQHQLPPMIDADKTFEQALEESGQDPQAYRYLKESYFKDRYNEAPDAIKRMLSIQYRMHPDIMAAINQFYEHPLECGLNQPDSERDHQLESALVRKNKHLIWVTTPLVSVHMPKQHSRTIAIRNRSTGREVFRYQSAYHSFGDQADATSYINLREGELIEKICEEFQRIWALKKAAGAPPKEIGVITFYASQANLLYDRLLRGGNGGRFDALNIRIGTVDRFQGMERAVIIVSMVRNNSQRDIGFARRDERINVAFSRAQQLLIIVGCHDLFCGTARYEEAVERYDNISKIVKKRGDFIDVSCI